MGLDIQRLDQEDRLQPWEQQMDHPSVWILSWHCNFEKKIWSGTQRTWRWLENWLLLVGHCGLSNIDNIYSHLTIDVIHDLTRIPYIPKLKITNSWYSTKSKASTGVKNTVSYIPWLYITWDQMVASNMIYCALVLMTTTITQAFCIKFKPRLLIILKFISHI